MENSLVPHPDNPQSAIRNPQSPAPHSAFRIPHWFGPAVVVAVFLVHCLCFLGDIDIRDGVHYGMSHLPLDDSWIHLSYAKNLLRCGYFTYNPGEVETGATSPLWVVVLAACLAVLRHPVLAAKLAGIALATAGVAVTFTELRRAGGRVAAWTGALMLALDPMWAMGAASGMEIPLTGLILVLIVRELPLARPWRGGVLLGLLVLARPDMGPVAAAAGALLLWAFWLRGAGRPGRAPATLKSAAACAALAFAVAFPWFLYCRLGTGHWLPCTFYVKGEGYAHLGWDKVLQFISLLEHGYYPSPLVHDPTCLTLLALGLGYAVVALWRRPAMGGWLLLLPVHVAVWSMLTGYTKVNPHPGQYATFALTRYYIPDYPLLFGVAGLGAGVLWRGMAGMGARLQTGLRPRVDRAIRRVLVVVPVLMLLAGNFFGWWTYTTLWVMGDSYLTLWKTYRGYNTAACRNIYEIHEQAGRWIDANIPANVVIAIQDAGAIRYFTRHRVIDLWGLNSHAYLFARDKAAYLRSQKVKIAVIFPSGRLDPLFDFKPRRILAGFSTFPNQISEGALMDVREIE